MTGYANTQKADLLNESRDSKESAGVNSPKQPQPERLKDWYPYYAGFASEFVERVLSDRFEDAESLIDPWNGSGTTTAVGAGLGKACLGLDINPAVTVIARARLTPVTIRDSLVPIADEIVLASMRESPPKREPDPLSRWLRRPAVETVRRLQRAIHRVVVGDGLSERELAHSPSEMSSQLPLMASFFYAALFAAARDILKVHRGSNPTWLRYPESFRHRLNPAPQKCRDLFVERVEYLADRLSLPSKEKSARTSLRTESVLDLSGNSVFDACFTSPPYATRIDYVRTTLSELSVLGLGDDQVKELRRTTTGTPVVKGVKGAKPELLSNTAASVVDRVRTHPSHGSANYYAPWISNYLGSLEDSFVLIDKTVSRKGKIGVVVQDSFYKSVHVDLQRIVTETLEASGRRLEGREDYSVAHSMAHVNPASRTHNRASEAIESLLVFT